ncbi:MAG: hypothetical protein EXS05_17385 [Planctomycetaceae bacterium]|nr:hypothetical protein [Planctomycetaceae bacterium]
MKFTDRHPLPATIGMALSLAVSLGGCQSSRMRTAERTTYDTAYDAIPVPEFDSGDPLPVRPPDESLGRPVLPPAPYGQNAPRWRGASPGLAPDELIPEHPSDAEAPIPAATRRAARSNSMAAEFTAPSGRQGAADSATASQSAAQRGKQLANPPREIAPEGKLIPLNDPPRLLVPPTDE